MKISITFFVFFMVCGMKAQTTAIPDTNFEQALIDLGIDSDGTLNGQVLTSDISNIINLNISNSGIYDLTGIEGFLALKNLNVSDNFLETIDMTNNPNLVVLRCDNVNGLSALNLSENSLMEELYCSPDMVDVVSVQLTSIDLSNNPNMTLIEAKNSNLYLETINLKTGVNAEMTGLMIDISSEGFPRSSNTSVEDEGVCIQVDNKDAALQNGFPYSTWTISDANMGYYYSENCALNTTEFLTENISIFPNPTSDLVFIESPYPLKTVEIYTLNGVKIQCDFLEAKHVDMRSLASGIYFIKLSGENGNQVVKKIVKR